MEQHLDELLASECLAKAEHSRRLLRYLVERALRGEAPKEVEIAIDVFGRDATFSGSEASQVRVAVRTLRLKLDEYYASAGRNAPLQFHIPKGAYRLVTQERNPEPAAPTAQPAAPPMAPADSRWKWAAIAALAMLAVTVLAGGLMLLRPAPAGPKDTLALAASPIWSGLIDSDRPLTIVLGDQFMYSQVDIPSGRTNMVRDTSINSSEELRRFLASNPDIAAGRGQRYMSMLQKNTAVGMADVLQLVSHAGRRVQVRVREEMQVSEVDTDIIYIGPLSRLGPLAAQFELQSRYRFDRASLGILDSTSGLLHRPEGDMDGLHKEYALAARFRAPDGRNVLLITPGGRNSGLLMVVRMLTDPTSVEELTRRLGPAPDGFELLIELTVNRQTDLTSRLVEAHVSKPPEGR